MLIIVGVIFLVGGGLGDPHIRTLDGGIFYTYNPIGEFWMIRSENFSMQSRMVKAYDINNIPIDATQFQAFVLEAHTEEGMSDCVQIELNNNRTG